jgi:hypothetical protein
MKKITTLICFALIGLTATAQWTYKTINSEFDGKFKKAYVMSGKHAYLAMEQGDEVPMIYLSGSYFCDENSTIEVVLHVNGTAVKYDVEALKSSDSRSYYISDDIWTEEFTKSFKLATKCSIRVSQEYCTTDYFSFNMSGSTAAFNFIMNK